MEINRIETINSILKTSNKKIVITNLMGYLRFLPSKKLWEESTLNLSTGMNISKNLLFIVLATISFYLITMSENYINGFIFQLVFTLNLVGVFYGGNIIHFIKKFVTEKKISKK